MSIPRPEFPNPQFERSNWLCLNGKWDFEFDFGRSKQDDLTILTREKWEKEIIVPFCPESDLSGIGYKDFIPAVWYRKKITATADMLKGRVFLCFGAVDYDTTVYVNEKKVGTHRGGYTSFRFDITDKLTEGENTVIVHAVDDTRSPLQCCGKQSHLYYSHGCHYTRTTGIWQSVWLECTPVNYIKYFKLIPDAANGAVTVEAVLQGKGELTVSASYEGKPMGSFTKKAESCCAGEISLSETHLWEPGCGRLYDLEIKFGDDTVKSYFGLRDLAIDGYKFLINGKSVFQRLVLDQGFYPDGIYTAPTDEALKHDIELSMAAGFNGARLHEKVFDPRFHYYADKMGYITWGEYPNWGIDYSDPRVTDRFVDAWTEAVERDFNHPSIVGWCPFNETWDQEGRRQRDELLATIYKITKAIDKTRPCIDTSGNYHVITDIWDVHNYEQDVDIFKTEFDKLMTEGTIWDRENHRGHEYEGGIVFVSEYGGIGWTVDENKRAWGYGNNPKTEEEFKARYKGLTDALLDNDRMFAFCYTQLTDVEQEQNGVYTYDRKDKFEKEFFYKVNSRKAAIED